MYKINEKTDLSQISLTGARSLILLEMLSKSPRTLDEIKQEYLKREVMEDGNSDDIIRIDLNTLRTFGCTISRASSKTDFKYKLKDHPYNINVTLDEVAVIKKAYKKIRDRRDIKLLRSYDDLFIKIAKFTDNEEVREAMYGLCALKNFNRKLINDLLEDSENHNELEVLYKTPTSREKSKKIVVVKKLEMQNEKIYLLGYDKSTKESVMLNVKRIVSVISRKKSDDEVEHSGVYAKLLIKSFGINDIDDNTERIVEKTEKGYIVEANYFSEFLAIQRILSFGANCIVLEPSDLKEKVISKLKEMRSNYNV